MNGEGCAFIFEDQDGVKVSSETFRGKYIYLDIWATWCGPCKQEMPYMQKLEQQYRGEKYRFCFSLHGSVDGEREVETIPGRTSDSGSNFDCSGGI